MKVFRHKNNEMRFRNICMSLAVFLMAGVWLNAQSLAVADFKKAETDMDARVNYPEKDWNGKTCAIIKVETTQTGFSFDTGTLAVTKTSQRTGEIWVWVSPGTRKLTISHPSLGILRDYPIPIPVEEATVYILKLLSGTVTTIVNQGVQTGFFSLRSEPDGADVWIDGEWVGQTPFDKKFEVGSSFQYKVTKTLYHEENGRAVISGGKNPVSVTLCPAFGSISVTSVPSGADVYLDDDTEKCGTTPCVVNQVASGGHRLSLRKDMYSPLIMQVSVSDSRQSSVSGNLKPRFATLSITSVSGAVIKINGEVVSRNGSHNAKLMEGFYDVEASLAGHRPDLKQVEITAGVDRSISLKPLPMYGSLSLLSSPTDAEVWIDGVKRTTTPDVIGNLLVGEHKVVLKKSGYEDYTAAAAIKENAETSLSLVMKKRESSPAYGSSGSGGISGLGGTSGAATETITVKGVSFTMVRVEGGSFDMGATSEQVQDAEGDEKPVHRVTLGSYYIGKTEVTQALWEAVMVGNPIYFKGKDNPVESVSWHDCQEFIRRLNSLTGKQFRLPTEAEWEFAARGGNKSRGYKYSGSDVLSDVGWYEDNSGDETHPVAQKQVNELGLYDMSGNVWEWCSDRYDNYSSSSQTNPAGPSSGVYRVVYSAYRVARGGDYYDASRDCRVSYRGYGSPTLSSDFLGLRLVLVPEDSKMNNETSEESMSKQGIRMWTPHYSGDD